MSGRPRHIDARAQAAVDHQRAYKKFYVGPLLIRNLPAVIPKSGDRRTYRDGVTVFLLSELIGVHRVDQGKNPYWVGDLYQLNRDELAGQYACEPDDISSALSWLARLGLVEIVRRTRIDGDGKPRGTMVFAVPRMDRIKQALDFLSAKGRAMTVSELMDSDPLQGGLKSPSEGSDVPLKDASAPLEGGAYLNSAQSQQKPTDSGGAASAQRPERTVEDDRGSQAAAGGGGAADHKAHTPATTNTNAATPRPAASPEGKTSPIRAHAGGNGAPAPSRNGSPSATQSAGAKHGTPNAGQSSAATPSRWTAPEPPPGLILETDDDDKAWRYTARFAALYAEAIQRDDHVSPCKPTAADLKVAFHYFKSNPQANEAFTVATAFCAWRAKDAEVKRGGFDPVFHCRKALDMQTFLRLMDAGKIMSEIGALGWEINAWTDLRHVFTISELVFFGFKVSMVAQDPDELWENDERAPDYYRDRKLSLPPEVAAAEDCRRALAEQNSSNQASPPGQEKTAAAPPSQPSSKPPSQPPRQPVPAPSQEHELPKSRPAIRRKPVPADELTTSTPPAAQEPKPDAPSAPPPPPDGGLRRPLIPGGISKAYRNPKPPVAAHNGLKKTAAADEPSISFDEAYEVFDSITRGEDPRVKSTAKTNLEKTGSNTKPPATPAAKPANHKP